MLEPYDGKLSSTVLRGERTREGPALPGTDSTFAYDICAKRAFLKAG